MLNEPIEGLAALAPDLQITIEATDPWWFDGALRAIEHLAMTGRPFTSDDVRDIVGNPDRCNQIGPTLALAHSRHIVEIHEYRSSTRPTRKGGTIKVWIGTPKPEVDAA